MDSMLGGRALFMFTFVPMTRPGQLIVLRYAAAVAAVAVAWTLTRLLWALIAPNISPLYFAAVMAAAWFGGFGPGVLAVLLASVASTYLAPFRGAAAGLDAGDLLRTCTLAIDALLISWLKAARARAQEALREANRLELDLKQKASQLAATNAQLRDEVARRKRAQEETLAHQDRLRHLSAELSMTQERERRQIATQLHDEIGQVLAISQMKLESLGKGTAAAPPAEAVDEVRRLVESAVAHTRSLTRELSPPVLYEARFESAMEWLCDRMHKQYQLPVTVTATGTPQPLGEELRVFLFQAVRELLVNIVKHAGARAAQVSIFHKPQEIRLVVEDDGRGFRAIEPQPGGNGGTDDDDGGGYGLLNIRERLTYLGGQLDVESDDRGARMTISVPLSRP